MTNPSLFFWPTHFHGFLRLCTLGLLVLWSLPSYAFDLRACSKSKAEEIEQMFGQAMQGFKGTVDRAWENKVAVLADQLHQNYANQLGVPQMPGKFYEESVSERLGPNGEKEKTTSTTWALPSQFDLSVYNDPKKKRERVETICRSLHGSDAMLAKWCADAFFRKEENLNAFLKQVDGVVQSAASQMRQNPKQSWASVMRGKIPTESVDGITQTNMLVGQLTHFNNALFTISSWYSDGFGTPHVVLDGKGEPAGLALMVAVDDRAKYYFAPFDAGAGVATRNPLFYMFNSGSPDEWNRHWEGKFGSLTVNGLSLSQLNSGF